MATISTVDIDVAITSSPPLDASFANGKEKAIHLKVSLHMSKYPSEDSLSYLQLTAQFFSPTRGSLYLTSLSPHFHQFLTVSFPTLLLSSILFITLALIMVTSEVCVLPLVIITALTKQNRECWLNGAHSISLPGIETLLKLWALEFWREVHFIAPLQQLWCNTINWLWQMN